MRGVVPPGPKVAPYNSPAARRRPVQLRDLRAAQHPRVGRHQGTVAPVERGVLLPERSRGAWRHADHRARRAPSPGAQRRAASRSRSRAHPKVVVDQHDGRADGHRAPSALRREQVGLHLVPQAALARRTTPTGKDFPLASNSIMRGTWDGKPAHRRQGHLRRRRRGHGDVADRVRPGRHALHDHRRPRHRSARESRSPAARQRLRRQDPAHDATTAACRRTIRSSARPASSRSSTRWATARSWAWRSTRSTAKIWAGEQGPNGGDEVNILQGRARTTAGRSSATAATIAAPTCRRRRTRTAWSGRTSCGCRRSRCRAWCSTPATASPTGSATCSSAACAKARSPAPANSQRIVFNDNWEELRRESLLRDLHQRIRDVRQGPDGLLYVLTEEDAAALLKIEPVD